MPENKRHSDSMPAVADGRRESQPTLAGIVVREDDIELMRGIRFIAWLFRGMAVLLVVLMILQLLSGLSGAVPASPGVLFAEAVRLVIFAGLLWGAGDLAVLWIKSHYDIRASRILLARMAYMMRETGEATGTVKPASETSRADRAT
ncbi:MAG: hypothetical protein JWL60_91 [Gemmatimonadetes bacterium]|jgi:hypothetical protein|nr:hypothetical protein [Gemmatimonadota bacterium]